MISTVGAEGVDSKATRTSQCTLVARTPFTSARSKAWAASTSRLTSTPTYTAERRPVAQAVLANTLAQAAIMRPDPQAQAKAMRQLVAELLQLDDVNRLIGAMTSGLAARYELGLELDEVGRLVGDRPIGHGAAGASLYAAMQDGSGVLLDASGGGLATRLATACTRRIRYVAVDSGPSLLIRPDACVAWSGAGQDLGGLEQALRRWFVPAR